MIIRKASTLGFLDAGWIFSKRTFSNNTYWDPNYKNWKSIRVINDDCQLPGNMVPKHRHCAFDILGYMVQGELEHWDSLGNVNRAVAGQIQHMHCGKGIFHTEASVGYVPARYLQIWIINPNFKEAIKEEPYYQLVNKSSEFGPLPISFSSGIKISGGILNGKHTIPIKSAYMYVVSGSMLIDQITLSQQDGAELSEDLNAEFLNCHFLLFEQD